MKRRTLLGALGAGGFFGFGERAGAQPPGARPFNGLSTGVADLCRLSSAKTRSISPENFTGAKGQGGRATTGTGAEAARDLGPGWKISPSVKIAARQTFTLAEITGPGAIQHIWMTPTGHWRFSILRVYWDGEQAPSIEVPVGDFFASGWGRYGQVSSLAVAVNPGSAFNSYWVMPFRRSCRITVENVGDEEMTLYYQVTYALTEIPEDAAYLHAQFRRVNPLPLKQDYTIVEGIRGEGQYVGTHMAIGVNNNGWWGEGEIKFFLDGDAEFPTICGTGTEDYFCGSYNFENGQTHRYQEFTTPYSGLSLVTRPDGLYDSQQRFSLYRWHITDPIRFERELRVTIQSLGWQSKGRYLPQQNDMASVGYWYQSEPHAPFPALPAKDALEIV
jgi:hypothetical protein